MALHRRFTARNCLLALALVLLICFVLKPNVSLLQDRGHNVDSSNNLRLKTDAAERLVGTGATSISGVNTVSQGIGKQVHTRRTAVVVASQASEDATWLDTYFPKWEKNVYHVDSSNAKLTVPKNKGRESMVYLT